MTAIAYPRSTNARSEPDQHDTRSRAASIFSSGSASLTSNILNYRYENGRHYHAYSESNYARPDEEPEPERLDMLHHIFKILAGGDLWRAPIDGPNSALPKRVLDLAAGTGLWAMEAAEEFPGATIVAVDSNPIVSSLKPSNCEFVVDDLEAPWRYGPKEKLDFVHGRALSGAVADFPKLLKQIYDNLNPGGWVEFQDCTGRFTSDDQNMGLVPALEEWHRNLREASEKSGKPLRIADEYRRLFQEAGFVDVKEDRYKGPIGTWAQGKTNKELGQLLLAYNLESVEPFTEALNTRGLGYSLQQTQKIVDDVRKDFMNKDAHIYLPFTFVYGRKPL